MSFIPPTQKIPVGILGATGLVGQRYAELLNNHPWFTITHLAASANSAGQNYRRAILGRTHFTAPILEKILDLPVHNVDDVATAAQNCRLVFSAIELPEKSALRELENSYAAAGLAVVSNASAHRGTDDVPMLIPEINHSHLKLIEAQRGQRSWPGCIVVKPNCSLQSYLTPLYALEKAGYTLSEVMVTTLQAVSGAGYPGVASLDIIDNVVPYIGGEEDKTEQEPLKILGTLDNGAVSPRTGLTISAHCNRVPVIDGHLACVSLKFKNQKPTLEEIINIWQSFRSLPQEFNLPFAPAQPIIYRPEENRPQPRRDRDADKGMAVTVGRLRPCPVLDYKFVGLSHNTIRGAAGGGILNAELLVAQGYINKS